MPTTLLALFALFTVGSAEVTCNATGTPCTDGSKFIGTCTGGSGSFTCSVPNHSTCAEEGASGSTACDQGYLKGMCVAKNGKCKHTEAECTGESTVCRNIDELIGTCTSGKCVLSNMCGDASQDASCTVDYLKGTCLDSQGICKYSEASCIADAAADRACMDSGNLIGKCVGSSTAMKCKLVDECGTVSPGGKTCGTSFLKGRCLRKDGKCKYTVASCAMGASKGNPCRDTGNLIGKCDGEGSGTSLTCKIEDKCNPGGGSLLNKGAECSEGYLKGKCEEKGGKCLYEEATCLTAGISCMDSGDLIGKCVGTSTKTCQIADMCQGLSSGSDCAYNYLKGKCVQDGGKCKYSKKTCTTADDPCTDNGELIGKCAAGTPNECKIENKCVDSAVDQECTEGSGQKMLKGKCVAVGGKCRRVDSVKVDYTIEVPKVDPERIAHQIVNNKDFLPSSADATSVNAPCVKRNVSPSSASLACEANYYFFDEPSCTMTCNSDYVEKTAHSLKCGLYSTWGGVVGGCAKKCPLATTESENANSDVAAGNMHGSNVGNNVVTFFRKVENGKLVCKDIFNDSGSNYCTLECDNNYRVKTASMYGCASNATWAGTMLGVCEDSVEVSASVSLVLGANDDFTTDAFKTKFRAAVASKLIGVGASHVEIKGIRKLPNSDGRRLDEMSVNVDYTVHVAKGDAEGATELDKLDGRLLIAGGLRGIR